MAVVLPKENYVSLDNMNGDALYKTLEKAFSKNDSELAVYILSSSVYFNKLKYIRSHLNTGILTACEMAHYDVIKSVLELGKTHKEVKEKFNIFAIDEMLPTSCKSKNSDFVKYLCSFLDTSTASEKIVNDCLNMSALKGDLDLVRFFLQSPTLPVRADINYNNSDALKSACFGNQLETVKYLMTSEELKQHAFVDNSDQFPTIQYCNSYKTKKIFAYLFNSPEISTHLSLEAKNFNWFIEACNYEKVRYIKYLLTHEDYKGKIDVNADKGIIFFNLCYYGKLDTLKFLLTDPSLDTKLYPYFKIKEVFSYLLKYKKTDILEYLILDYKIKTTPGLDTILKNYPEYQKLFDARELKEKLTVELDEQSSTVRRNKL